MAASFARRRVRRSFTLVEMLVVIVIIGILAGLITGAALVVQRKAKNTVMRTEIADLEAALVAFKEKFGDYPPDGTDGTAVTAFVARAFPRYRLGTLPAAATSANPTTALVFWLGGMPDGTGVPNGFSANPTNPFDGSTSRIGPFYEFNRDRMRASGTGYQYLPPNGNAQSQPYVYFKARAVAPNYPAMVAPGTNCIPCLDLRVSTSAYANAKSYQIRSPGLDGIHGKSNQFPNGTDYDQYQYDDVANFADGTLGDRIP
jgi:prepilin-type N-terminal cleavage/methylation domain-containing protein